MSEVTPQSFRSESPPPRIIGSEMEYNIQLLGGSNLPQYAFELDAIRSVGLEAPEKNKQFVSNGARIYSDVGHTEYATPECLGPLQALHADIAGQNIMLALAATVDHEITGIYRRVGYAQPDNLRLKDNEHAEATTGYHENYLAPSDMISNKMNVKLLESHLATRNIWGGMGMVGLNGFYRSQKSMGIGHPTSRGHVRRTVEGGKPFALYFSARDTHNESSFPRLEVRSAESNTSNWARFLSFATTSLILRLIEQRDSSIDQDILLSDALDTLHKVSRHTDVQATHETISGKRLTAAEHQEALATAALRLCERTKLPDDEVQAAHEWLRISQDLQKIKSKQDYPLISDRVEWAARFRVLRKRYPTGKMKASNNSMRTLDLKWDQLGESGVGSMWWRRQTGDADIYRPELAKKLQTEPPEGTRATERGRQIKERSEDINSIDWGGVTYKDGAKQPLVDPYV